MDSRARRVRCALCAGRTRSAPAPRRCARPRGCSAGARRGSARRCRPTARRSLRPDALRRARSPPAPRAAAPPARRRSPRRAAPARCRPRRPGRLEGRSPAWPARRARARCARAPCQQLACLRRVHPRSMNDDAEAACGTAQTALLWRCRRAVQATPAQTAPARIACGDGRRIVVEGDVARAERHVPGARQQPARARRLQAVGQQAVRAPQSDRHRRAGQLLGRGEACSRRTPPARRRTPARPTRRAASPAPRQPAGASVGRTSATTARCARRAS